jgi:DNA helicase-2/ATP-dependent DNA helicase PcrA
MKKFLEFLREPRSDIFKKRVKHILFDEYQDINQIQNLILCEMNISNNLTVVGDDAQAIYAFRGSEVNHIINFHKKFSNSKRFRLEINYRSPPEIINICNDIIKHNKDQLDKKMISNKKSTNVKPKIIGFDTNIDEVQYITKKILDNKANNIQYQDQLIICRTNRQLDNFELELIKSNISYIKSKGIGILDRTHIKDFLAFLIILVNPKSILHWKRILLNVYGLGPIKINKIISKENIKRELLNSRESRNYVSELNLTINKIFKAFSSDNPDKFNSICDTVTTYLKPLIKKNMRLREQTTYEEKLQDLITLQIYLSRYTSLEKFLEDIHLNVGLNKEVNYDDDDDYILLSTIHGSKGLE